MELFNTYINAGLTVFMYMTALYLAALWRHDNSIADIAWGPGFILAAWSTLILDGQFSLRQLIASLLVLIWGLRLSVRIFLRNRGKGEDERYRKWREEWGKSFIIRSYLQVFLLQGCILLLNIAPIIFINTYKSGDPGYLDLLGVLLWVLGFFFESVADRQLDRFIKDPGNRGKIMDRGLWRYSRHPNYFGEVTMWWGIYILALSVPWGWVSIIGPLTISYIILFVSGVPMTEKFMEGNPAFADYKRRTSAFIPWFPQKTPL
jgi:steroid 5-alpha reductase family enzyme